MMCMQNVKYEVRIINKKETSEYDCLSRDLMIKENRTISTELGSVKCMLYEIFSIIFNT